MKALFKYLLITLIISTYSVGVVGVGTYNCYCSHSGQIVLLAKDECACQHKYSCCPNHTQEQTTEESCCNISYQVLQLDQVVNSKTFTFNSYSIIKVLSFPIMLIKISNPCLVALHSYDPPPLESSLSPDIYCLAQLRL